MKGTPRNGPHREREYSRVKDKVIPILAELAALHLPLPPLKAQRDPAPEPDDEDQDDDEEDE